MLLKNWYLINFKPRPQTKILVLLSRSSFQNFRRTPASFLYGAPLEGWRGLLCSLHENGYKFPCLLECDQRLNWTHHLFDDALFDHVLTIMISNN